MKFSLFTIASLGFHFFVDAAAGARAKQSVARRLGVKEALVCKKIVAQTSADDNARKVVHAARARVSVRLVKRKRTVL